MSLDGKLVRGQFYIVGPDRTKIAENFIILRVVGEIKKPDVISSKISLEDNLPMVITDLPSDSFYKKWVYIGEIILPKNISGRDRTVVYVINLDLRDFKEILYDRFREEPVMRVYKSKTIAYIDSRFHLREKNPYIVVIINEYVRKKLPEGVIRDVYKDLYNMGIFVKSR